MFKTLFLIFAIGGWASTAMLAASDATALEVSEANMTLNQVMILLLSVVGGLVAAIGWGLRSFSQRLLGKMDSMESAMKTTAIDLSQVKTTVELRERERGEIDYLKSKVTDLLVAVAKLEGKRPRDQRDQRLSE